MRIELNSLEVAEACSEYAARKLGGSGKYSATVSLVCKPVGIIAGEGNGNFSATVELRPVNGSGA